MPERFRGELLTMGRYTNPASFSSYKPKDCTDVLRNCLNFSDQLTRKAAARARGDIVSWHGVNAAIKGQQRDC